MPRAMTIMKLFIGFWICLALGSANALESRLPKINRVNVALELNGKVLDLVYIRDGVPGSSTHRKNGFSVFYGKQCLWELKADETQDILIRLNSFMSVFSYPDRSLLILTLFASWDGEDPSLKTLYVVTDGDRVVASDLEIMPVDAPPLERLKMLVSEFQRMPLSDVQSKELEKIELRLRAE